MVHTVGASPSLRRRRGGSNRVLCGTESKGGRGLQSGCEVNKNKLLNKKERNQRALDVRREQCLKLS